MTELAAMLAGAIFGTLLTLAFSSVLIPADKIPDFKQQAVQHCGSGKSFSVLVYQDRYAIECENGVRVEFSLR